MTTHLPRLRLPDYFAIEGANALAGILFLYCMYFWTESRFGYGETLNLLLTALHGLIYVAVTIYGGRLSDRMGYDRLMTFCLLMVALLLLFGWIPSWAGMPFVIVGLYTMFIGPIWPALEATILHCPGRATMPQRLGFYNITWGLGDGLGCALSAWLFAWRPDSILYGAGAIHLLQWAWLKWGPSRSAQPGQPAMELAHRGDDVPRSEKRRFMHTAWLGNGLAYLMLAGFAALSPDVGRRLALEPHQTILLLSTLLFARFVAFIVFWRWEAWHYDMRWAQFALWIAPAALAVAFFVPSVPAVFAALVLFGCVIGLSYSGSLYYSLDYGENKGEHGGLHESILGVGIFVGPLVAAGVSALGGGARGAAWTFVLLTLAANAAGILWIRRRMRQPA